MSEGYVAHPVGQIVRSAMSRSFLDPFAAQ
jgi:hypothetical protein